MVNGLRTKEYIVPMIVKKSSLYLVGIVLLVVIAGFFFFSNGSVTGNVINGVSAQATNSGDVQVARLSVSGGTYVMSPSTFKVGQKVRLEADIPQMPGCSKSIIISAFNIRKIVSSSDNVIEFTPDKAGTFNIACSMNMYKGTFSVVDGTGKAGNYVEQANTQAGSCGSGGGGCGCGGF